MNPSTQPRHFRKEVSRPRALRLLLVALLTAPMVAQEPARAAAMEFEIDPQPLSSALREYADQSHLQVLYSSDLVEDYGSPGVTGTYTVEVAMGTLLSASPLGFRYNGRDTIVVTEDDGPGEGANTPQEGSASEPQTVVGEAITVTGTHITQIEGETALPLSTLDEAEIALREPATTTEILETIPQASGLDNRESSTGPNDARGDASSVNLRGLGSESTLVLVNGRRLPPHPISSGAVPRLTVNVNAVPSGALDRVEVLRDGASAIYGTDAAAGVVNLILRDSSDHFRVRARYGERDDGALDEGTLALSSGFRANAGRTGFFVYGDAFDRTALRGSDTDFAGNADLRERAGSTSTRWDNRSVNTPYGQFRTGLAQPDGSFRSRRQTGAPDDDFHMAPQADGSVLLTFGSLPRDLRYNFAADSFLIPETNRENLYFRFDHDLNDSRRLFGDVMVYHADSLSGSAAVAISGSSNNDLFVPKTNYYNPFGTRFYGPGTDNPDLEPLDVVVRNYRPVELGERFADVESESYRLLVGMNSIVGQNWLWESSLSYGKANTLDLGRNMLSESRLRSQLALSTPDAWNVFNGLAGNPQAVLDQVRITTEREGDADLALADIRFSGLLGDWKAGPILLAAGAELRRDDFTDRRDPFSLADDVIALSETSNADGDRDVSAAYAELSLPLLTGSQELALTVAGRWEHFSDFGDTVKPKVGLAWRPARWLLARGSYNEGFKAPNLAELFTGEIIRRNEGVEDPYRAEVTGTAADLGDVSREVRRGGNLNLEPEESETTTVGLVFQPQTKGRLFLSIDYWDIEQTDLIATFGHEDQLDLDLRLRLAGGANPDVVRAAPTAADIAAFDAYNAANPGAPRTAAGEVLFVRDTFINLSLRQVSGWDAAVNYRSPNTDAGTFTVAGDVSYYDRYDEKKDEASPELSQLLQNGNPRFRGTASVSWNHDKVSAGLLGRFVSEFEDTSAPVIDDQQFVIDDWLTWNAFFGYGWNSGALNGLDLRLSVTNLFDEDPPLADDDRGFDTAYHSPRGRMFLLTVLKSF